MHVVYNMSQKNNCPVCGLTGRSQSELYRHLASNKHKKTVDALTDRSEYDAFLRNLDPKTEKQRTIWIALATVDMSRGVKPSDPVVQEPVKPSEPVRPEHVDDVDTSVVKAGVDFPLPERKTQFMNKISLGDHEEKYIESYSPSDDDYALCQTLKDVDDITLTDFLDTMNSILLTHDYPPGRLGYDMWCRHHSTEQLIYEILDYTHVLSLLYVEKF